MVLALLQGISFGMAPLLSIGPFKIFVLSQSLQRGWRNSLYLAFVPLIADIPVIIILWLLLQQLPKPAVNVLRVVGGGFYIYLAYRIVKNSTRDLRSEDLAQPPQRTFLQAITAVWVTPAVYINWSTIGIPAMLGYIEDSIWHMASFVLGFYILWIGGLAFQIFLVGRAGDVSKKVNTWLVYFAALLLVWFGIYQFWIGAATILGVRQM